MRFNAGSRLRQVLCWNKGHSTPVHEHSDGVRSWAKVLTGELLLKRFSGSKTAPRFESQHNYAADCADCILEEGEYSGLHLVANASQTATAVSLHLYSPPYVAMGFVDGRGVQQTIPVRINTGGYFCCVFYIQRGRDG